MPAVEVLGDEGAVGDLAPEWSALADACGARAPSYPWWCLPWWRTLGRGRLQVVTVRDSGRLIGLAPFHLVPAGPAGAVRFLGHAMTSVSRVLAEPGREAEVGRAVWPRVLARPGLLLQLLQYEKPAGADPLAALSMPVRYRAAESSPVIDVLGADRPPPERLARILRRADRALAREGAVFASTVVTTRSELGPSLAAMAGLVEAAEGSRPRGDILSGAAGRFTAEMLGEAADAGRLRLYLGWVGPQLAAFHVGLLGHHSVALWGHRSHPGQRRFSPGHLNIRAALGHARSEGIAEVDLFPGPDPYKLLWADRCYPTVDLLAAVSRPELALASLVLRAARRARAGGWLGARGRSRAQRPG